jgi:hypothetical protein
MKNKLKRIFASVLILGTISSFPLAAYADELPSYQTQNIAESGDEEKPVIYDIIRERRLLQGSKAPTGTSFVDLANNDYSYYVEKIGYEVFTNSKLSGVTSMKVLVTYFNVLETNKYPKSDLTVTLYSDDGKSVGSFVVKYGKTGDKTFTGLNKSKKYYVKFGVPTNSQTYEIKGKVVKG